jgi:hypothetical protein
MYAEPCYEKTEAVPPPFSHNEQLIFALSPPYSPICKCSVNVRGSREYVRHTQRVSSTGASHIQIF